MNLVVRGYLVWGYSLVYCKVFERLGLDSFFDLKVLRFWVSY